MFVQNILKTRICKFISTIMDIPGNALIVANGIRKCFQ